MKATRNALLSNEKKSLKNVSVIHTDMSDHAVLFAGMTAKLSDHDKVVVEMLKKTASDLFSSTSSTSLNEVWMPVLGHPHYLTLRKACLPHLSSLVALPEAKAEEAKDGKVHVKRADEIRTQNTLRRVQDYLQYLHAWMGARRIGTAPVYLSDECVEVVMLRLMRCIQLSITTEEKNDEDELKGEAEMYELVCGVAKIRATLARISNVSPQLVKDLDRMFARLKEVAEFDVLRAAAVYPRLFIRTGYDKCLPGMGISPYPSQVEVLSLTLERILASKRMWLWLHTLTGEGKTSLVVGLAKLLMSVNAKRSAREPQLHLLYACHTKLRPIRYQVGQCCVAGVIPFGVTCTEDKVDCDHSMCAKMDLSRVLTIADTTTALDLLSTQTNNRQYLLFYDEPTFGLDSISSNHPEVVQLGEMINRLPVWTIFATATAPTREEMPRLSLLPTPEVEFVTSTRVQIGSEISSFDGRPFIPHLGCRSVEECKRVVTRIQASGFHQKCYTANVVNRMFVRLAQLARSSKITPPASFREYMAQPEHMNQPAIQALGLTYLEWMAIHAVSDEWVQSACDPSVFTSVASDDEMKHPFEWSCLCDEYERFENQTLIVARHPEQVFATYIRPYLERAVQEMGQTFADLWKTFGHAVNQFEKKVEELKESLNKLKKLSQLEREKLWQEKLAELEEKRPTMGLPKKWILGSRDYYRTRQLNDIPERLFEVPERTDWDSIACQEWFQFGLAIGVGVLYDGMSPSYGDHVMEMAAKGYLAYLITDDRICYGTNYPFENVVVDGKSMESHSLKTVFQLFARAGRPGKSWRARILAEDSVIRKLSDDLCCIDPVPDQETINMNAALERLCIDRVSPQAIVHHPVLTQVVEKSKIVPPPVLESWEDEM